MNTTLTDHSRWPRGMCRERTSTVKLAGGFIHFLPEGHEQVGKLARLCRSMYGTRDAHESRNRVPSFLLQFAMEISKDCAMVMTSVWLHDRSSCKPLEKSLRNGLR